LNWKRRLPVTATRDFLAADIPDRCGRAVAIRGRLDSAAGTGTWTVPARGCGGRWVAERRG